MFYDCKHEFQEINELRNKNKELQNIIYFCRNQQMTDISMILRVNLAPRLMLI